MSRDFRGESSKRESENDHHQPPAPSNIFPPHTLQNTAAEDAAKAAQAGAVAGAEAEMEMEVEVDQEGPTAASANKRRQRQPSGP